MSDASPIRLEGRVAIVTGAGSGLGAAHARLLSQRGARVVVNDCNADAASAVVAQIRSAGGIATVSVGSVEAGEAIVADAMNAYGTVDILINNAGILRDRSFHKMTEEEWDAVYRVHVLGTWRVTRAAWIVMRDRRFGRVIMTSSAAALYGNFGQANYSMAKLGVTGLAFTLAREGVARNILVNTIIPSAASALSAPSLASENLPFMAPELVSPLVVYLCDANAAVTGAVFEVGVGRVAQVRIQRAAGVDLGVGGHTPEDIRQHWSAIEDFSRGDAPRTLAEAFAPFERHLPSPVMAPRN